MPPGEIYNSKASRRLGRQERSDGRFNGQVSSTRVTDALIMDLEEVKAVRRSVPGATVNDVIVSIVGGGIADFPEVAAQMFSALGDSQINIDMISSSEVKLSCVIAKSDAENAVRALHERFKLDAKPTSAA